jgi:hypothetical protein
VLLTAYPKISPCQKREIISLYPMHAILPSTVRV